MKKPLDFSITREVRNVTFFDVEGNEFENHSQISTSDGDLLLFFANKSDGMYPEERNLVAKSFSCTEVGMSIDNYFEAVHKNLRKQYGEVLANLIIMDVVNGNVDKFMGENNIDVLQQALEYQLRTLSIMAYSMIRAAHGATEKSERWPDGNPVVLMTILDAYSFARDQISYGIKSAWFNDEPVYCDIFTFKTSEAALMFDLAQIAKNKITVKRCKNCGRFFVPRSRSDEIYCNNIFKSGKTCKEIGYDLKVNHDETIKTYRKIYKTQNARKQRNSHKADISVNFARWTEYAKQKLDECQNGVISLEELTKSISSDSWMSGVF